MWGGPSRNDDRKEKPIIKGKHELGQKTIGEKIG